MNPYIKPSNSWLAFPILPDGNPTVSEGSDGFPKYPVLFLRLAAGSRQLSK